VIDVGLNYTKCGFSKDSVPMHVVPTTIPLVQLIRDNLTEYNVDTFAVAFEDRK